MAIDHRINRHTENFKGIDKRSSNIQRTQEFATNVKNCSFKTSGAINKRKGYHINTPEQNPFYGATSFGNRDNETGAVTQEMILVNDKVNILKEYEFKVSSNHPRYQASHSLTLDPDTQLFSYNIYNYNTDEYILGPINVGDGFGQDKLIYELVNDINKIRTPVFRISEDGNTSGNAYVIRMAITEVLSASYENDSETILDQWAQILNKAVMANVETNFEVVPPQHLYGYLYTDDYGVHHFDTNNSLVYYPHVGAGSINVNGEWIIAEDVYAYLYSHFLTQKEINTLLVKPDDTVITPDLEDTVNYAYMYIGHQSNTGVSFFIRMPVDPITGNGIMTSETSTAFGKSARVSTNNTWGKNTWFMPAGSSNVTLTNITFNQYHGISAEYTGELTDKVAFLDTFVDQSVVPYSIRKSKVTKVIPIPVFDEQKTSSYNEGLFRNISTLPSFNPSNENTVVGDSYKIENATFAEINNVLYISNGHDVMLKYDGNFVYQPGLPVFPDDLIASVQDTIDSTYFYKEWSTGEVASPTKNIGTNEFRYDYMFRFAYEDAKGNIITGEPCKPITVKSKYASYRANEYEYAPATGSTEKKYISLGILNQYYQRAADLLSIFKMYNYNNGNLLVMRYISESNLDSIRIYLDRAWGSNVQSGKWYTIRNFEGSISRDFYVDRRGEEEDGSPYIEWSVTGINNYDDFWQFRNTYFDQYNNSTSWNQKYGLNTLLQDFGVYKEGSTGYYAPDDVDVTKIKDYHPNHKITFYGKRGLLRNNGTDPSQTPVPYAPPVGYDVESEYESNYTQDRKGEDGEIVPLSLEGKKLRIEIFRTKMYNPGGNSLETPGQFYFIKSIPYDEVLTSSNISGTFVDNFADEYLESTYVYVDETGLTYKDGDTVTKSVSATNGVEILNPFLVATQNIKRHDPPPKGKYLAVFKNVLVLSGQVNNVNNLQYSLGTNFATGEIGSEYFPEDDNGVVIQSNFGDRITAIAPLRDLLYIFHKNSIHVLGGNLADPVGIPYAIDLLTREGGVGCLSMSSIVEYQNSLSFIAEKGIFTIDATNSVNDLSDRVRTFFNDTRLSKQRTVAFNWVDENCLVFSIPIEREVNGVLDTYSNVVLVYDYFKGAWLEWDNLDFTGGVSEFNDKIYFINRKILPENTQVKSVVASFNDTGTTYDFSDHNKPIPFSYETNWESLNNPTVFKKFLRIKLFSFDTDEDFETPQGFTLKGTLQVNYKDTDVGEIFFNFAQFTGGGWGLFKWGDDAWGNTQSATLKSKLLRNKAKCLKINFSNDEPNTNILLTSYEIEMATPYKTEIKE